MNALIQALGMDYYTMGGGIELSVARGRGSLVWKAGTKREFREVLMTHFQMI